MKHTSLLSGIIVAIAIAILAYLIQVVCSDLIAYRHTLNWVFALTFFAYSFYLFNILERKRCSVVVVGLCLGVCIAILVFQFPPIVTFCLCALFINLIRSFWAYESIISAACDATLMFLSLLLVLTFFYDKSNIELGVWVFFLCQSLFVFIPERFDKDLYVDKVVKDEPFIQAYQSAEEAISRLSNRHSLN